MYKIRGMIFAFKIRITVHAISRSNNSIRRFIRDMERKKDITPNDLRLHQRSVSLVKQNLELMRDILAIRGLSINDVGRYTSMLHRLEQTQGLLLKLACAPVSSY